MIQYFYQIIHTILDRYHPLRDEVLLKVQNILTKQPGNWAAELNHEDFFHRLQDFLQTLYAPYHKTVSLYLHKRDQDSEWKDILRNKPVQFTITRQLQFFVDEQDYCILEENNPLFKKITETSGRSISGRIYLFHFFSECDFMVICPDNDLLLNKNTHLMELIIKELQVKTKALQTIDEQQQQAQSVKKDLLKSQAHATQMERLLKKRAYEIHNLIEISNELYSILNFDQLINSALLTLVGQLSCQRTFAMLYNPAQRKYSQNFSKGFKVDALENLSIEIDHPLIPHLLKKTQPLLLSELPKSPKLRSLSKKLKALEIEVIAPLLHRDRLSGIIGCGAKLYEGAFDDADIQILSILVNIISISISNSRMYEDVKQMSFTDAMTNLNNYRYFETRLIEEINRCRRNKTAVSLLMLDIDEFKNYNDELGHQAGDEALRTVGWILKNTVRDGDIVNRYGGEEFAIILPGMEKDLILILADRIRSKVEEYPFFKEHVQPGGSLTVSLGGATYPDDAEDFETLVQKADQALYYSKRNGKNRCSIYDIQVIGEPLK